MNQIIGVINTEKKGKKFISQAKRQAIVNQSINELHAAAQNNYDVLLTDHLHELETEIE